MASPAKIQGVLLHPAVTGCSEASSSWQHSPARLLKVVHPVLNRAARRTSDALGDSERKTEGEGRGKGGGEGGWREKKKKNYFKVTNRKHFSDVVPGLRPPVCPHADADACGRANSHSRVPSTIKKQTNKKKKEPLALGLVSSFAS